MPKEIRASYKVIEWLMFQMASVGPMLGQAQHFRRYAPEKLQYAIDRYTNEAHRIYGWSKNVSPKCLIWQVNTQSLTWLPIRGSDFTSCKGKLAGRDLSSSSNGRPGRVRLLCALAARKSPCLKARWLTRSVVTLPGHGSAIWGGGAHESFSEAGRLLLVKTGGLAASLRLAGYREPASPPLPIRLHFQSLRPLLRGCGEPKSLFLYRSLSVQLVRAGNTNTMSRHIIFARTKEGEV